MSFNFLEATPAASTKVSLFQIEFYQQFFNIDTMEVVDRLASSMIPKRAPSTYLKTHLVFTHLLIRENSFYFLIGIFRESILIFMALFGLRLHLFLPLEFLEIWRNSFNTITAVTLRGITTSIWYHMHLLVS